MLVKKLQNNGSYFDSLYGQINLPPIVFDFIKNCSELQRLRDVGLMNFKSFHMLGLTNISRLEHTIGLSYLCQLFSEVNNLPKKIKNELIVAALYHDINCAPFGHSIEWALNRYGSFDHVRRSDWILSPSSLDELNKKPIFFDSPGLWKNKLPQKYRINIEIVKKLVQGEKEFFFINNPGVDLDNIDNVFRMAQALGFKDAGILATKLVQSLFLRKGFNNFIIRKKNIHYLKEWHKLRSSIYKFFIYSDDYLAYEFLLFQLADKLNYILDKKQVEKLWFETDQGLLIYLRNNNKVRPIIRRLMKGELYFVISIFKIPDKNKLIHNKLKSASLVSDLCDSIKAALENKWQGLQSKIIGKLYLHVTTDFEKTNRKIEISSVNGNEVEPYSFGENKNSTLIALISEKNPPERELSFIKTTAFDILSNSLNTEISMAKINRLSEPIESNQKIQKQQSLFESYD